MKLVLDSLYKNSLNLETFSTTKKRLIFVRNLKIVNDLREVL